MRKIKGIVVAVLSLVMVMSGSITAFAEELPKEPVAVESIASPAPMTMFPSGLYEIKGEGVRLRRTASETGEVIGLLYEEDGAWVMIRNGCNNRQHYLVEGYKKFHWFGWMDFIRIYKVELMPIIKNVLCG